MSQPSVKSTVVSALAEVKHPSLKILIVGFDPDDHDLIRDLLSSSESEQFKLELASSYEESLEAIDKGGYDICIVKDRYGKRPGLDIIQTAVRQHSTIPCLILADAYDRDVAQLAMARGAADYLAKDVLTSALLERTIYRAIFHGQILEEHKKDEERYRTFAEAASDWFWEMGPDQRFTYFYTRKDNLSPLDVFSVLGKTLWEVASSGPNDDEDWTQFRSNLGAHHPFKDIEFKYTGRSGRIHNMRVSGRPFFDSDGNLLLYRGTGSDITAIAEVEAAAEENARLLQTVFENTVEGISVFDSELNMVAFNNRFLELLNFPADKFKRGDNFEKFIRYNVERGEYGPGDVDEQVRERVELARRFEPHQLERTLPDGRSIEIRGNTLPTGGFVTTYTDITERKRMEIEVQDSEARFRDIAEAASDWIWETDENLKNIFISERFTEVTGIAIGEVLGRNRMEVVDGNLDDENWRKHHEDLTERRPFRDFQYTYKSKTGKTYYWSTNGMPIFDSDGNFKGYRGTGTDMTAEQEAKKRADTAQSRFMQAIEKVSDGFALYDPSDRLILCNDRYRNLNKEAGDVVRFGMNIQELWQALIDCGTVEEAIGNEEEWLRKRLEIHRTSSEPRNIKRKDLWIQIRETQLPDGSTFIFETDVTTIKKQEVVLQEREERLRGILDHLNEGVVTIQIDGMIESFNAYAEHLFGYSAEEIIGKNVSILMPEEFAEQHDTYLNNYTQSGESEIMGVNGRELTGLHKDGSTLPLELGISELRLSDTRLIIGVIRDVSARKDAESERARLEGQLRQSQKMEGLGTLAGGIAHDLNNTLVPILGLTELTMEDLPEGSTERTNLEKVIEAARRGRDLVSQILTFSRQDNANRAAIDLGAVIKEVHGLLEATLPKTIEIRQQLDNNVGLVMADETQIHQVLMNMGANATHAMGLKGGVFSLSLDQVDIDPEFCAHHPNVKPGPHAILRISDTGCGMDEQTLERIFDPFFTTKDVGEGTGMGLSVVHGIIQAHGGEIIASSALGSGTTFEIYLPIAPITGQTEN